jgi:hypothetical protein
MYAKDWAARIGYIVLAVVMCVAGALHQNAYNTVNARLKILEAAKTAAQQPQSRHYFARYDSLKIEWVLDSSIIKK